MGKELTTRESTDVALSKSKSFMGIIKNIFNNKVIVDDDSWMQRLWDWADRNNITDLEWIENEEYEEGGFWRGFPRDKDTLLNATKLVFDEIEVKQLPKEIGNLRNITEISLMGSQLMELPKEIGLLNRLTMLTLWGNQLTSLPKEIGNLTNLTVLILGENQFTELPEEIGNLGKLSRLLVWDNQLITLPKEIENLRNLTRLDLEGNRLTHLPKEIGNLTSLSELILKGNLLTSIPGEIGNLINLKELHLGNNKLKALPGEIRYLNSLKILALDNNSLSEIPKEVGELKHLEELYLRNNQIIRLPDEITNLTNIDSISLESNQLILTEKQKEWFLGMITSSQAFIYMDDEPLREVYAYESHQNNELESIEALIQEKGLEYVAQGVAELVDSKIHTKRVALQFVLEELDAARSGNQYAYDFVQNSGFKPSEYIDAMSNSFDEVDGSDGPQMTLHSIGMMSISDMGIKVELTLAVVDKIMQKYSLGKYS